MRDFLDFLIEEKIKNKNAKVKILAIQGSARNENCCPDRGSKSYKLLKNAIKDRKDVLFDVVDLSVKCDSNVIQPCKACISTAGGIHCHWPCIEGNQRVHLMSGFKEIKNIKIGDILQDGNKVTNHILTAKDEKIYQIKLEDGRCLKLTKNHKIKVLSKNRYRDNSSNFAFYRKEEWKELGEIKIGDNIPKIELDDKLLKNKNKKDYLYTIFGLLWGDGTLCGNSAILYVDSNKVDFINNIKSLFHKDIVSILEHKNPNCKIRETQKSLTKMIKINFGTKIGKEFKSLFEKNKATERRLNLSAFKNKNQIFNFLNGWISTDGSVKKIKNSISIYNTSYELLRDLQLLLSRISIESQISDLRHKNTKIRNKIYQRCSSLSISDQNSLEIIIDNIKLLDNKKDKNLKQKNNKRKIKRTFSRVKSIEYIGLGDVYDIEVENSHFFNCEGIKVHNCDCYSKGSEIKDFMHEENIYKKLEKCDGFVVFSPINWDAPSSVVKSFFDRLVCCNLTLTVDDAKKVLGKENIKNSEITRPLAKSGKYNNLLKNHLEGKHAAFFMQGDNGADDYKNIKKPDAYLEYMKGKTIKSDPISSIEPIVKQLIYSGVYVKEGCVDGLISGFGTDYPTNDDKLEQELFERSRKVVDNLIKSILNK